MKILGANLELIMRLIFIAQRKGERDIKFAAIIMQLGKK